MFAFLEDVNTFSWFDIFAVCPVSLSGMTGMSYLSPTLLFRLKKAKLRLTLETSAKQNPRKPEVIDGCKNSDCR
jgi:hypothetical protein